MIKYVPIIKNLLSQAKYWLGSCWCYHICL